MWLEHTRTPAHNVISSLIDPLQPIFWCKELYQCISPHSILLTSTLFTRYTPSGEKAFTLAKGYSAFFPHLTATTAGRHAAHRCVMQTRRKFKKQNKNKNREKVIRERDAIRRFHCPYWGQEVTNGIFSQAFKGNPPLPQTNDLLPSVRVCPCCFKRCGSHPAVHAGSTTHDWKTDSQLTCWLVCLDTWYYVITCTKPIMWKKWCRHRLKRDCQTQDEDIYKEFPLCRIDIYICLHVATCYTTYKVICVAG